MDMDTFLELLETARHELEAKQDALVRDWKIGSHPRWWQEQEPPRL